MLFMGLALAMSVVFVGGMQKAFSSGWREMFRPLVADYVDRLVADLARWARHCMEGGAPLVHRLPGRAGWELRLVVQGGLRVLDKIDALQGACLTQRPRIRAWDAPLLLARAMAM